jgi:hypothetical protein
VSMIHRESAICFQSARRTRRSSLANTPSITYRTWCYASIVRFSHADYQHLHRLHSTPIDFGTLQNVEIKILGNLHLPQSIPYIQNLVNASAGRLYWFTVAGDNVTLSGNQDPDWGYIDAYGQQWWTAAKYTYPLGGLVSMSYRRLGRLKLK